MRPMLAVDAPKNIKFPVYASPKLDGIRCLIKGGVALSRTLKPIPNQFVQDCIGKEWLEGLDGELIVGEPTAGDVYRKTTSGVMSRDGEPDFKFYVFDYYNDPDQIVYEKRLECLKYHWPRLAMHSDRMKLLDQAQLIDQDHLDVFEHVQIKQGFEGVILRSPDSPYKHGRSTAKEGYMLKVKRFKDAEAKIIGFEELMHNGNAATVDHLGLTARSSHKNNLIASGTLGALVVKDLISGLVFRLGTGYNAHYRNYIWLNQARLLGATVKYKYFEIGVKDLPRHPVWIGFRDPIDL